MLHKHEANPQENNNTERRSQQRRFATLVKSHPHKDTPKKIRSIFAEHPSSGEHLRETASACQEKFKKLTL